MRLKKAFAARVIIIAAIIAMIVLSYISFTRINRFNDLSELVNHTHAVHVTLEKIYSQLRNADSELNAFLLTDDSAHFYRLLQADDQIKETIAHLKNIIRDQPQKERIAELDSIIHKRYSFMESSIKNPLVDINYSSSQIGLCNIEIAKQIEILINEQNRLLHQREQSIKAYKAATPILLFTIEIIIILFLFVVHNRVVSELKLKSRLQEEIEVQIHFIQAILENSVDMIVVFDREMNIISANRKAKEMLGITDEMIGKHFFSFFPQGQGSKSHQALQAAFNGESVHIKKQLSLLVDRTLESFFVPLSKNGSVYAVIVIHHDITDLVKTSEELESKNLALVKSNEELERFAYVASHDLQEPLRKIRAFTKLAQQRNSEPGKTTAYLQKISNSAERMTVLINEVLNYSRLSTQVKNEKVDLNDILEQVRVDFELLIQEKGATIECASLPVVEGSSLQLFQVFSNLVSNALKFTVRTPIIKITCKSDEHFFEISVIDNGIGFESKFKEQVFEIFSRLQNTSDYAGSGIGLAVCKRIITNHKGTIEAHSTPGVGTTFIVRLPKPQGITLDIQIADPSGSSKIELPQDYIKIPIKVSEQEMKEQG
jgi:PAS domain S-box-containing protein